MPEYNICEETLTDAISRLVQAVTEDAIKDEAREWQNCPSNVIEHRTGGKEARIQRRTLTPVRCLGLFALASWIHGESD